MNRFIIWIPLCLLVACQPKEVIVEKEVIVTQEVEVVKEVEVEVEPPEMPEGTLVRGLTTFPNSLDHPQAAERQASTTDFQLYDSLVSHGIMIGHPDKLGIGLGLQVIPLTIELAHTKLRFEGVQLRVRKTNLRAIGCYKACGFRKIGEGTYINIKGEEITFLEMQMYSD